MKNVRSAGYWKCTVFMIVILVLFFFLSLGMERVFKAYSLIPAMFALAVFLISLLTQGYIYGIIASLLSVLAVNYAFTFPYFKLNFSIHENLVSAVIMLVITVMSSTLTTKVKQQEKMKSEHEKEKLRANLLRAVSHDLRTPLTTIYGSSATIAEQYDCLTKEQIINLAKAVKEDAQWLISMVENLLSITKVEDGMVRINKSPVVLEEFVDSVLIRFKKRYPGQKVNVDIPEEFVMIPMDAMLMGQVLYNILENAVQHATGMTFLGLRVYVLGRRAVFEVTDDGCGIQKDRLHDIFRGYFEKKDGSADSHKSSMGIGLSVCASIVKAHEGDISVENRKDGGCCFRFSLGTEVEDDEQQV